MADGAMPYTAIHRSGLLTASDSTEKNDKTGITGTIFDIDSFSVHDGPGIRMAVYFKGCPLRCAWCHSPESQTRNRELVFIADRCTSCGACVEACPESVHSVGENRHAIDRTRCITCGACVEVCPAAALQIKGYDVTSTEVVRRAKRLTPFFRNSNGGVTLTGGEVCLQPDFACEILERCRKADIHTAVETSGFAPTPIILRIADLSDLILYDLKLADDTTHRRHTGQGNLLILENLMKLPADRVIVRTPLIPGITDTVTNIESIAHLAVDAGVSKLELLPYNTSAAAKYEWLGREYTVTETARDEGYLDSLVTVASIEGLEVSVSR